MDHPLTPLTNWFVDLPAIRCPTCGQGMLTRVNEFDAQQSAKSRDDLGDPDAFDPDLIGGVFTGMLICGYTGCTEKVAVVGQYGVDIDPSGRSNSWMNCYKITYARPAFILVACPPGTPEKVRAAATAAAEIAWADPSSAAGRLRVAVEELLTCHRIPRSTINRNHKRVRLDTHQRIEKFAQMKPDVARVLMAVKWIGNSGSHEGGLGIDDVLEGAQMLSHALGLLYDTSVPVLMRRVNEVNRRGKRGPRSRPRTGQ
ncbi:DUF4145 domain-containing protein [Actinoplanes sp. NPDC049802]|uniref:DUF4145 domain-containing protein n=1 Tax=Actinoplanes sp. NPDC049802 TaxID=3154742 RepID=UPI003409A8E1